MFELIRTILGLIGIVSVLGVLFCPVLMLVNMKNPKRLKGWGIGLVASLVAMFLVFILYAIVTVYSFNTVESPTMIDTEQTTEIGIQ